MFCKVLNINFQTEDGEKEFSERVDLNHCSIHWRADDLAVEFECHFKKYSRSLTLFCNSAEDFEVWRQKLEQELKFADDSCLETDHFIIPTAKLRQREDVRSGKLISRSSIGYIFDGMRKKRAFEQYKTL